MLTGNACKAHRWWAGLMLGISATVSVAQSTALTEPPTDSVWTSTVDVVSLSPQDGEPYVIVGDRHFILQSTTNVYRGDKSALRTDIQRGDTVAVTPEPGREGLTPIARRIEILEFREGTQ